MKPSFKSLWSRNPDGWSAIDVQGGVFGVKVRLPKKAGEKPTILQQVAYPGQAADGAVLGQMARALSSGPFQVVTLLGRRDYQMLMMDKPAVRPDEMEGSLRLAISPSMDYPVAQANLAWLDIPARQTMGNRVPQIYAVIAKREVVNERMALFEKTKLPLQAIDIRESAQRNIALLLGNDKAATCLIFADPDGVQLTITYKGDLYLVRFISESLFSRGDAGIQAREQISEAIERLALEIQRSFDFVRRNYPSISIDSLYVGPTAVDINLPNLLKPHLMEEVKALNLLDLFDLPQSSDLKKPVMQAQYFHALGSALRMNTEE
jgi:MSHA biogenesis protein MshI